MINPLEEQENMRQARSEYDEREFEMLENLSMVLAAARESQEGTITFIRALRLGGYFEPKKAN